MQSKIPYLQAGKIMQQYQQSERKYLFLGLIIGLCGFASFATLFNSVVPFSVFPIIAFVLSVHCFREQNRAQPMTEGTPILAFACFLVGGFGYSAFARMETPELGGNFFSIIVCMSLLFWVLFKTGWLSFDIKKDDSATQ